MVAFSGKMISNPVSDLDLSMVVKVTVLQLTRSPGPAWPWHSCPQLSHFTIDVAPTRANYCVLLQFTDKPKPQLSIVKCTSDTGAVVPGLGTNPSAQKMCAFSQMPHFSEHIHCLGYFSIVMKRCLVQGNFKKKTFNLKLMVPDG